MSVEKLIVDHMETWTSALQTRSTAGRGSSGKIDLYGIKKLRELILELAVRGKLVPQDPNDEPASELLKRIAAEKAELVKQGKIKKQKPLPEISEEEKPFELPEGWEWVRISEIGHDWGQKTPDKDFTYIDVGSINKEYGIIEEPSILSAKDAPSRARKIVQQGTIIYSTVRPYLLNIAIIENEILPEPIASTAFAIIHPYTAMDANFIYYYLRSPVFVCYVENCQTGVAYPAINDKQFFSGITPVPPSLEQVRIANKIKELMSLCDQLEQQSLTSLDAHQQLVETLLGTLTDSQTAEELAENWARISEYFDTLFTTEASVDALKQTILQLAVMGKLVPQDPNDEPASELLKRIAQEKAQLVKVPYLRVANVQRGYLDLTEIKQIEIPIEEKEKYQVVKGDLLITEGGDWDTVGRTTVWCHDWYIANQNHVFKGRNIGQDVDPYWLETYMNSPFSRQYFANASKQTTNLASINKTQLRGCPVAIPPSSEAKKIMSKLHIFYKLCEELKNHIQSAQQTQLHLADALTDAAVN
ncbi:restriction endonuclease subunit S [Escherichia coli]|nr:restriction endonuclease subunit S [Escherichia coli]